MHRLIYVCSPLRGNIQHNREKAIGYSRYVYEAGHIPITPHAYLTLFLDDTNSQERQDGMSMGLSLLKKSDEIWVFGNIISTGMAHEIAMAKKLHIPIKRIITSQQNRNTKETLGCYGKCDSRIENKQRSNQPYTG